MNLYALHMKNVVDSQLPMLKEIGARLHVKSLLLGGHISYVILEGEEEVRSVLELNGIGTTPLDKNPMENSLELDILRYHEVQAKLENGDVGLLMY